MLRAIWANWTCPASESVALRSVYGEAQVELSHVPELLPVAQRGLHQRQRGDAGGIRAQDPRPQGKPQRPGLPQQQRAFFFGKPALGADQDVDPVSR